MKATTWAMLFLTAVVGGFTGMLVVNDKGYVLIAYDEYTLETTLWLAIIALILLYMLARLVFAISARLLNGRGRLGLWTSERRARSARAQTVRGLLLMAEGRYTDASKLLLNAAHGVETPLINYLNAARAAHELGELDARDGLLRLAHESTPGAKFAVALTQAQLQMAKAQWEQCLATLLQLKSESPRHPLVLEMLKTCYQQVGDWQALVDLIPALKKQKVVPQDEAVDLAETAWREILKHTASSDLTAVFDRMPKELRRKASLINCAALLMCETGALADAEGLVRGGINTAWNEELVGLYGCIISDDPKRQLVAAQSWLKERPNDATLLMCIGRISMMNQAFSEAREYFEASLALNPTPEVHSELGRLCLAMGDYEKGGEYLAQSLATLPVLPLPVPDQEHQSEDGLKVLGA
ncbi:MAG: heme biosynthesis protein HemY [Proteobacteria bacterium]|nr:heme biosynthesis protein HemY [Pseudomonadota bacterium]